MNLKTLKQLVYPKTPTSKRFYETHLGKIGYLRQGEFLREDLTEILKRFEVLGSELNSGNQAFPGELIYIVRKK